MDMEPFFCIGYELCKSNFEESGDYDELEEDLKERHGEDLSIDYLDYDNDPKLFIYFKTMFKDGVYLLEKQMLLDSIVKKEKIRVIGFFQPYSRIEAY